MPLTGQIYCTISFAFTISAFNKPKSIKCRLQHLHCPKDMHNCLYSVDVIYIPHSFIYLTQVATPTAQASRVAPEHRGGAYRGVRYRKITLRPKVPFALLQVTQDDFLLNGGNLNYLHERDYVDYT